jgi:hypothetical protein
MLYGRPADTAMSKASCKRKPSPVPRCIVHAASEESGGNLIEHSGAQDAQTRQLHLT